LREKTGSRDVDSATARTAHGARPPVWLLLRPLSNARVAPHVAAGPLRVDCLPAHTHCDTNAHVTLPPAFTSSDVPPPMAAHGEGEAPGRVVFCNDVRLVVLEWHCLRKAEKAATLCPTRSLPRLWLKAVTSSTTASARPSTTCSHTCPRCVDPREVPSGTKSAALGQQTQPVATALAPGSSSVTPAALLLFFSNNRVSSSSSAAWRTCTSWPLRASA